MGFLAGRHQKVAPKKLLVLLVPVLLTVAVGAPRFAGWDPGFIAGLTGVKDSVWHDDICYVYLTQYFRGETVEDPANMRPPYAYRIAVPLLAAALRPLDERAALALVNLLLLVAAIPALYAIAGLLGFSGTGRFLTTLIFPLSFPLFYYGTVGYVDAAAITLVVFGWLAMLKRRYLLLGVIVFVGALTKEVTGILVPMAVVTRLLQQSKPEAGRALVLGAALLAVYFAALFGVRAVFPFGEYEYPGPRLSVLGSNLTRPRAMVAVFLTLLPLLAGIALLPVAGRGQLSLGRGDRIAWYTGVVLSTGFIFYSASMAYLDGRMAWPLAALTIPFVALVFERVYRRLASSR
jgi:hypothetical protein